MKNIAVLLTVFNRKNKTLLCLENLYKQEIPQGYAMDVYLTNDGCTDGTPEAIIERFPQVHIINAKGDLFWNRGMYKAWEESSKNRDYDYFLWLNDDSFLVKDSLKELLLNSDECNGDAIIVATMCSKDTGIATYGGYSLKENRLLIPDGSLQECATMNGNCVLIPKSIYNKCGNLDWAFRHAIGDLDYGYRARKAGFKIYASKRYLGYCEKNAQLPKWARTEIPFIERWKNLYSPQGYAEPIPFFHYEMKNFGLFTALKHFISIHIRVLFPVLWKQN